MIVMILALLTGDGCNRFLDEPGVLYCQAVLADPARFAAEKSAVWSKPGFPPVRTTITTTDLYFKIVPVGQVPTLGCQAAPGERRYTAVPPQEALMIIFEARRIQETVWMCEGESSFSPATGEFAVVVHKGTCDLVNHLRAGGISLQQLARECEVCAWIHEVVHCGLDGIRSESEVCRILSGTRCDCSF